MTGPAKRPGQWPVNEPVDLTAARNWCTRITAAAEDIAREKRKAA